MSRIATGTKDKMQPLDLGTVQVGGEIGRRIAITVDSNLLALDVDHDFIRPFEEKRSENDFIGLGLLLDAVVRLAVQTGDARLHALRRHIIDKTLATQDADGYIGFLKPECRIWAMWNPSEMMYVILGLVSDYHYFKEPASLAAARRLADHFIERWPTKPPNWEAEIDTREHNALVGSGEALLALYAETGDAHYLNFLTRELKLSEWRQEIVIGRRDRVAGHVYGIMHQCLAQLRLYRFQGDKGLLQPAKKYLRFLTRGGGMTITGGAGLWEAWTDDQDGRGAVAETCATTYQLYVYDELLRLEGKALYGDLMERTLFNTLFAAQSPDGRRLRYFTPFEGPRVFFEADTYCCPCNYRRGIAQLPSLIYYLAKGGLAVNLYTASSAAMVLESGVTLRIEQETDYPSSGDVRLRIEPDRPANFPLHLRIPAWSAAAEVSINGQPIDVRVRPGSFQTIKRVWKASDTVSLRLPMTWRFVRGWQRQAGRAAVMRGPLLFTLNPDDPRQDKMIRGRDGADLGQICVQHTTIEEPIADQSVRPGGLACRIKGLKNDCDVRNPNLPLTLTEFADPVGKAVYFRMLDPAAVVADELCGSQPDELTS